MRIMAEMSSLLLILVSGCCLASLLPLSSAQGRKVGAPSTPSQGERLDARHSVLPLVRFECVGRTGGYYGDMDFGCNVFHFCADSGQRFTFQCSEGLKFNELTTSCSAGFFGDCTHPETVGPAGHNKSMDPEPVRSFQKISAYVGRNDDDHQQDPSDFQQDDPVLDSDYNYEYYDTDDVQSILQDVKPAASNRMIKNTNAKHSSSDGWGKSMMSTLSAFASLANIPYGNTASTKDERVDRVDEVKQVKYVDTIDRAFIARPSQRIRSAQRPSSSHFFQLPFFQGKAKKSSRVPQWTSGDEQSFIQHRSPYQPSPSDDYNPRAEASYEEPSDYEQLSQPYDFEDSFIADDDSYNAPEVSQTTPDTFRPSSRITNNPDDFQPVTPASKKSSSRESIDLVRPSRDATHQTGHGTLSSSFQSFSPSASSFRSPAGFSAPSSFGVPKTSRTAQTSTPNFLPAPSFPSSGNFVFNQPPIHPSIFNRPFHHTSSPSRTIFGAPPAPRQQVDSFGHPSPEHQVDIFGRPSSSEQHVDIFGRPSSEQQVGIFGRPTSSEHHVNPFGRPSSSRQQLDSFGRPSSPQHPVDSFGRPSSPQQPVDSFGRPSSPQQPVDSFGRPSSPQQPVDSFGRPSSPQPPVDSFGRPSSPQQPVQSFSHPPAPRPVQSFSHQPIPSFGHSPAIQPVSSFSNPSTSQLGQSFSPSPSPQPVQIFRRPTFPPHQPQSFSPPTPPPAGPNFGLSPASFSFSQPSIQQRPVQSFGRPTIPPAFIPHTTATSVIQRPFTPGFQQERPALQHFQPFQNSFEDSSEEPSSTESTFPLTEETISSEEASQPPRTSTRDRVFNFFRTTVAPPVSESSDVINNFNVDNDVLSKSKDPHTEEEPEKQNTERLATEQRPKTRRRPVSNQQEQVQPVRRRPGRPRRPTTKQPTTASPLITGLENSDFHTPFQQSNDRMPVFTRLQPQPITEETTEKPFVFTTPPITHVHRGFPRIPDFHNHQQDDVFQPQPGVFDPESPQDSHHLDNNDPAYDDIPQHPSEETLQNEIINGVESMEEESNIIIPDENYNVDAGEVMGGVIEEILTTTTPEPSTEVNRPFPRRRPNIRNRLRTRLTSRTTTAAPVENEPELPAEYESDIPEDYPEVAESPEITTATEPTTTLAPFRQRIQDRLNRLKSRRRNNTPLTTTEPPASEEDVITTTIGAPRKRPSSRRGNLDPDRFKRYRNRLRGISETSESSEPDVESTTTEKIPDAGSFTPNSRTRRINRFKPKLSQREGDNVLEVKEILNTDQEVQETSRSTVKEEPNFGQTSSPAQTSQTQPRNIEAPHKSAEAAKQTSHRLHQYPEVEEHTYRGETGHDTPAESSQHPDHDAVLGAETGRKIINPDFRARFREFLKSRKNQLSARYRATETPDIVSDTEDGGDSSHKDVPETSNPIFPEINQNKSPTLRELRGKFLSNRQLNDEEKSSRRIPIRPFRNAFSGTINPVPQENEGEKGKEGEEHLEEQSEMGEDHLKEEGAKGKEHLEKKGEHVEEHLEEKAKEGEEYLEEETLTREISSEPQEKELEAQETKNIFAIPPGKGTEQPESSGGFKPLFGPFPSEAEPSLTTRHQLDQEPEIITASPATEEGDVVMSLTVSANLKGDSEKPEAEVQENQEPKTDPPSKKTVSEIVIYPSLEQDDKDLESSESQTDTSKNSLPPHHSDSLFQNSTEEDSQSSQVTFESQEFPVLISVQPSQPEASKTAVPSIEVLSSAPSVLLISPEDRDLGDPPETLVPRVSKPTFNFGAAINQPKDAEPSAPDANSGEDDDKLTPTQFSITMATDAPRLPLEMLLPLFSTR